MSVFIGVVITCDSCGEHEFRHKVAAAETWRIAARNAGWAYLKSWGWHCPECLELDLQEAELVRRKWTPEAEAAEGGASRG